jgi:hypothetical protein
MTRIDTIVEAAKAAVQTKGSAIVWIAAGAGADVVADAIYNQLTARDKPLHHAWTPDAWQGYADVTLPDDGGEIDAPDSDIAHMALRIRGLHIQSESELRNMVSRAAHRTILRAVEAAIDQGGLIVVSTNIKVNRSPVPLPATKQQPSYWTVMGSLAGKALPYIVYSLWTDAQIAELTAEVNYAEL